LWLGFVDLFYFVKDWFISEILRCKLCVATEFDMKPADGDICAKVSDADSVDADV